MGNDARIREENSQREGGQGVNVEVIGGDVGGEEVVVDNRRNPGGKSKEREQ